MGQFAKVAHPNGSSYYVDATSGNDTTGTGTSGAPWATIQHALDNITRDTTGGDIIWLKSGTTYSGTGNNSLTLSTYGSPSNTAQLTFAGYTSSINDGGIATIDAGSNSIMTSTANDYINWLNLKMFNDGSGRLFLLDNNIRWINCELYRTSAGSAANRESINADSNCMILNCYFHDSYGGSHIVNIESGLVAYNVFRTGPTYSNNVLSAINIQDDAVVLGNLVYLPHTSNSSNGIVCPTRYVISNSVYANASTGTGIDRSGGNNFEYAALNNLVEGFSGTGGQGFESVSSVATCVSLGNTAYNNTKNYDDDTDNYMTAETVLHDNNDATATLYNAASSGDMDPDETGDSTIKEGAWPQPGPGQGSL